MKILSKKFIGGVIAAVVILFAIYSYKSSDGKTSYKTVPVTKGDMTATIDATGTVEPEELVDIGAQVAGIVESFGKDKDGNTIDYGSVVEANTVLARIDDSLYKADAALAAAQLQEAQAKLYQAQRDWERAQKLGPSEALAESSYDAYKSAYEMAKANVALSEATLDRAKQNLDYCIIKSPVKGVIIDRRVNIGQTVVSSLNAPSLFLLAKDLKRMQVWTSVNEADIGNIEPGQPVTFTVDAYPGQTFKGYVGKIRLNAMMTQNVVTYTVEVITDNSSGKLLPYLSADAKFQTSHQSDVLQVQNAALKWTPKTEQISPEFRTATANKKDPKGQRDPNKIGSGEGHGHHGVIWVQEGQYVKPIKVRTGINDGTMTEIQSDEIKEGLEVVVGESLQKGNAADSGTTNPFVPQMRRR